MSFLQELQKLADWNRVNACRLEATWVAVTEPYCRRRLRLKKHEPLTYCGIALTCVGSQRWRNQQAPVP